MTDTLKTIPRADSLSLLANFFNNTGTMQGFDKCPLLDAPETAQSWTLGYKDRALIRFLPTSYYTTVGNTTFHSAGGMSIVAADKRKYPEHIAFLSIECDLVTPADVDPPKQDLYFTSASEYDPVGAAKQYDALAEEEMLSLHFLTYHDVPPTGWEKVEFMSAKYQPPLLFPTTRLIPKMPGHIDLKLMVPVDLLRALV